MDAIYTMMVNERVEQGDSMRAAIGKVDLLLLPPEESTGRQNLAGIQQIAAQAGGLKIVGLPPELAGE